MPHCSRSLRFLVSPAGAAWRSSTGRCVADSDTPVSAYAKLGRGPYSFLLESVVGGEKWAAYSFVGVRPRAVIRARGDEVELLRPRPPRAPCCCARRVRGDGAVQDQHPVAFVDSYLADLAPAVPPGLPRFFGGAVGWIGYDAVRGFERLPATQARRCWGCRRSAVPHRHGGHLRQPARHREGRGCRRRRARASTSGARLRRRLRAHRRCAGTAGAPHAAAARLESGARRAAGPADHGDREAYEANVRRIQEYILRRRRLPGGLFAAVRGPARRRRPFDVYRALRVTNPSPYMFHLEFPEAVVTGASPEVLVRTGRRGGRAAAHRRHEPRGATPEEDAALARELLADPKERAEHVMLIDLGRNDVGPRGGAWHGAHHRDRW